MARGMASSASRYSGKLSHCQSMPSASAVPGDVLDALHQLDQPLVPLGRAGAKPTPQLPITTVVTPCHDDGVSTGPR
jgi:hypothetical protein